MAGKPKREHVFTEAYIKGLQPEAKRYEVHDPTRPGLVVRVTPSGAKSFSIRHRVRGEGTLERITIGPYPKVSVKDARDEAKAKVGDFAKGGNPAADLRRLKGEQTLAELWEKFLALHAKPKKRSWRTDEKRWNCHLAELAGEQLRTFTTARITTLLTDIAAKSGPIAANRVRALLHTMFEKGRKEWGLAIANPVQDTSRNPERSKERYLLPDELRRFLKACDADPDPDTALFLLMALWTGQRRGTLCAAKWEDLNLRDAAWSIPAGDMKAGRPLLVPLAGELVGLLKARREGSPAGDVYVFPADRPEGHTAGPRAGLTRVLAAAEVSDLTLHDLRRTFATWAQDAGAPLEVIGRLLGHTPQGGVTSVYARVPFDTLRRWVERTVDNMVRVAGAAEDGKLLQWPGGSASVAT